jgi:hypothetical protein
MTTLAQVKAQYAAAMPTFDDARLVSLAASQEFHIAASEGRLVEYAACPPIVKKEQAAIRFNQSILRMICAEQKARRQAAKVAA